MTTRRAFICSSIGGALAISAAPAGAEIATPSLPSPSPPQAPIANRAPLSRQPLIGLPTGAIKPAGWLRRQLEIQAHGLGGHLDETWEDVGPHSGWLGLDGEAWERGPYFIDGLLPLAWQLDDDVLKRKAQRFIDFTLDSQRPNGLIGPKGSDDWWPRMVILKALTQYHELTDDPRVIPVMRKYFQYQLDTLPSRPLRDWGMMRWQDNLVSVLWLYNRTGDAKLLELAALLQKQGYRWRDLFSDFPFTNPVYPSAITVTAALRATDPTGMPDPAQSAHGVNHGMGLKAAAVWSLVSNDPQDREFAIKQLAILDEYHGLPNGMFSCSEFLAGRSPSQGSELCTVVETLYSLEYALAVTGSALLADRIEKIAYNALPGTFDDTMWTHQYLQQPNQVKCSVSTGPWVGDGPESNLFGLDPNFGCCTANFHQGWPKLTSSLWMASANGGLTATVYAPCEVKTIVSGVGVTIREDTDYPFRHHIGIAVEPESPVTFELSLRIPAWTQAADIKLNGSPLHLPQSGGYARISREWKAGDSIDINFASTPRAVEGHNGSISFEDGPLVFALPIEEEWRKLRVQGLTADWEIYPKSDWAFAASAHPVPKRVERNVGDIPFSRRTPPVLLVIEGQPVPDWAQQNGSAMDVPVAGKRAGTLEKLVLMPYGAPKLRLTSFPSMEQKT